MLLINVCVCVLNFYFAYLSLRRRTIFYIGTLLILMACVCVRAFLAVIELLLGSVLKVGFYIMKWNVNCYL